MIKSTTSALLFVLLFAILVSSAQSFSYTIYSDINCTKVANIHFSVFSQPGLVVTNVSKAISLAGMDGAVSPSTLNVTCSANMISPHIRLLLSMLYMNATQNYTTRDDLTLTFGGPGNTCSRGTGVANVYGKFRTASYYGYYDCSSGSVSSSTAVSRPNTSLPNSAMHSTRLVICFTIAIFVVMTFLHM